VFFDFDVAALCNLVFAIWGSYIEQVWPPLEGTFKLLQLRFDQPS